jgi:putative restriction endonuclease
MARISKRQLLRIVEGSINSSGWNFLHLPANGEHPARYHIYKGDAGYRVKIYIWNISHGGGAARAANEYRIQITGIPNAAGRQEFVSELGGKTLILGWWDDVGVFAGFDYTKHSGELGASPSMQINEETLRAAHLSGFAPHNKGNGELAIAFRPDFIGSYIENLEALHECGESPQATHILDEIGDNPDEVDDAEIRREVPPERQYAVISTKKALRDIGFRNRVLNAYGHRCAMCGVQLKLLDAAHILPVFHADSTDETSNGISLCTLHHRAYDKGFVTFDSLYRTHINEQMAAEFRRTSHDGGLDQFRGNLRPLLILPPDRRDRPNPDFVTATNEMRGWNV